MPLILKLCISCCFTIENLEKLNLTSQWTVTATSSFNGRTFVASVENKKYPFFGVQFHPEKISYEWRTPLHTSNALKVNRYFFDFFVNQTRSNNQHFNNPAKETKILIYNFPVTYTAKHLVYMQTYFDPFTRSKGAELENPSALLMYLIILCELLKYTK